MERYHFIVKSTGDARQTQGGPKADPRQTQGGTKADLRQTQGGPKADPRQTQGRPKADRTHASIYIRARILPLSIPSVTAELHKARDVSR